MYRVTIKSGWYDRCTFEVESLANALHTAEWIFNHRADEFDSNGQIEKFNVTIAEVAESEDDFNEQCG